MALTEFRLDPGQILQPVYPSALNRLSPVAFGVSLTIPRGLAMGQKTADAKLYPLNTGASDGTQLFKGFNQTSCATDATGLVYMVTSGSTASQSYYGPANYHGSVYTGGVFDPADLTTNSAPVTEVDTFTVTTPTTGDVYTLTINFPNGTTRAISATVGATQTATAIDALLLAAWTADAVASAYATAVGGVTLVLTAAVPGNILNITPTKTGTGTIAKAVTTAATGRLLSDILAGAPGARTLPSGFWEVP